jgi:hypothetical protein
MSDLRKNCRVLDEVRCCLLDTVVWRNKVALHESRINVFIWFLFVSVRYIMLLYIRFVSLFSWRYSPLWLYFLSPVAGFSLLVFARFLDHTQRRTTVSRTPLDEWSVRRKDLYLTTATTLTTSMPPVGFEPTISAGERPKTYALDPAETGTGTVHWTQTEFSLSKKYWTIQFHNTL